MRVSFARNLEKAKKGRPPSSSACGSCRPKMQSEAHSFLKEAKNREKVKTPKPDPQSKICHCATQRESVVLPVSKRLKKPFRFKRHKAKQQKARCVLYELLRKSYSKLLEVRQGVKLVEEKSSETTRGTSMLCSIGIIAKHYGVSPSTIRRWAQRGLIKVACRTFGGHRRFEVPTVSTENPARKHIGYARVCLIA